MGVFDQACPVTDGIRDTLCDNPFGIVSIGFVFALVALILAYLFARNVLSKPTGSDRMREIAGYIQEGARSFLVTEYYWLTGFVFVMAFAVGLAVSLANENRSGVYVALSMFIGAFLSASAGYAGMMIATKANLRTTQACTNSLNDGLVVAFKSGAVMALSVCGLALLGLSILFMIFAKHSTPWAYISGFGFGASSIALFARVGGGVYTKAADVGADLVGKVESDIPEDDPRNPAVIADNVGDNVGDVAGMGADLFESYAGSIIAACALAEASLRNGGAAYAAGGEYHGKGGIDASYVTSMVALPFWVSGLGIVASVVGVFAVRTSQESPRNFASAEEAREANSRLQVALLWSIRRGLMVAGVLTLALTLIPCYALFESAFGTRVYFSVVAGLVAGVIIGSYTEYVTSYEYDPTKGIAGKSDTGPATVIIEGLGVGMISVAVPAITLVFAVLIADELAGTYGVAIAAVGMLSTLGVTLATDAYGPVADNAGGIAEMCEVGDHVRERTDALDALGNTTAATGKGFAIGSAVLTATALIAAFQQETGVSSVDLSSAPVLMGCLLGAMLPFLFAALTMLSVGKSAEMIILEVRRQYYETPEILYGHVLKNKAIPKPDYKRCVQISTNAAIKEMVVPGVVSIFAPAGVGFMLGAEALAGLLVGALTSGFMLAVTMANAGGAWDNAKKYVEKGGLGAGRGKKSDNHKATVVGDTVGDPFKDTSGPALNILIKLMSVVSLVLAPVFRDGAKGSFSKGGSAAGLVILVLLLLVCSIIKMFFDKSYEEERIRVEEMRTRLVGTLTVKQYAAKKLGMDVAQLERLVAEHEAGAGAAHEEEKAEEAAPAHVSTVGAGDVELVETTEARVVAEEEEEAGEHAYPVAAEEEAVPEPVAAEEEEQAAPEPVAEEEEEGSA